MLHYQKERLLKLADFLESLPRRKFDLTLIASTNSKAETPSLNTCGTAACAIGWMPNVFPRACKYEDVVLPKNEYDFDYRNYNNLTVEGKGNYDDLTDFQLAEAFFGLDPNKYESEFLFDPESYNYHRRGNKSVAARIRKFANGEITQKDINEAVGAKENGVRNW